jgi:hypothetical protein
MSFLRMTCPHNCPDTLGTEPSPADWLASRLWPIVEDASFRVDAAMPGDDPTVRAWFLHILSTLQTAMVIADDFEEGAGHNATPGINKYAAPAAEAEARYAADMACDFVAE